MRCFRAVDAAAASSSSSSGVVAVAVAVDVVFVVLEESEEASVTSEDSTDDDIKRVFWESIVPFDNMSNTYRRGNNPSESDDSSDVVVVVKALVDVIFDAIKQQRKKALATSRKSIFIGLYPSLSIVNLVPSLSLI